MPANPGQQRETLPTGQQRIVPGTGTPAPPQPPPIFDQGAQPGLAGLAARKQPPAPQVQPPAPPSLQGLMPGAMQALEAYQPQAPAQMSPAILQLLDLFRANP